MTDDHGTRSLQDCLAYVVLDDYQRWLGIPSPTCLASFLSGAVTRADLVGQVVPKWRVDGPLADDGFCQALAACMRHPAPALESIHWRSALENHRFCLADAMHELRGLMQSWAERHGVGPDDQVEPFHGERGAGLRDHLANIARRPAMYIGQNSGWALRCYLAGMDLGGDWLGLRPLPELHAIVEEIEAHSQELWGSKFGAYRAYEHSPSTILGFVGIEPT